MTNIVQHPLHRRAVLAGLLSLTSLLSPAGLANSRTLQAGNANAVIAQGVAPLPSQTPAPDDVAAEIPVAQVAPANITENDPPVAFEVSRDGNVYPDLQEAAPIDSTDGGAGRKFASAVEATGPQINLSQVVSQEPLIGGGVGYTVRVKNDGAAYLRDRGYNLTVSDTLPSILTYTSAAPTPSAVRKQNDGATLLIWDNIADLEAGEQIEFAVNATLAPTLTVNSAFTNTASAQFNSAPDNSGAWSTALVHDVSTPQAIDIEASVLQSTAGSQATGAGEYNSIAPGRGAGADWAYTYRVTVQNNNVASTTHVVAYATLPAGVAYLGNVTISPNPNTASTTPRIVLESDGSLELSWSLGALTTAQHAAPVVIAFSAAVPYRYRTAADAGAKSGPFAGPMSGSVIPELARLPFTYEATGNYLGAGVADGTDSTPDDDGAIGVAAKYLTLNKTASPATVGIGKEAAFSLAYYVSEYYTATKVVLSDTLPDGMTYVDDSASLKPASVKFDSPSIGRTTLIWNLSTPATRPGASGVITFRATVDETYDAKPYADQPLAAGDRLTNESIITGNWLDDVNEPQSGVALAEQSSASVHTRMPTFTKQVWNARTNSWAAAGEGFAGDTLRFKLTYATPDDVGAQAIVIRDYLPRGMTFVGASDVYVTAGTFADTRTCGASVTRPAIGALSGLQYIEWRLCGASPGSTWEVIVNARIADAPADVQPGWIVANFGKLSGQNTIGIPYSQRGIATVAYVAPKLVLTKTASPSTNLIPGNTVNFVISVVNNGTAPAYNLVLSDVLPVNLTVGASGGTATPVAASYSVAAGDPAAGNGGQLRWTTVVSLAAGSTQTFRYSAVVKNGVVAGEQLNNLASVSYNTRADNTGRATAANGVVDEDNTDDVSVYIRGATVVKTGVNMRNGADVLNRATIGDVVRWTITATIPAGVVAHWPVIEENSLPDGFDFIPGSTVVTSATLDTDLTHHPQNPKDNGVNQLRWYVTSIDNTAGATAYLFKVQFDTLMTGVRGDSPNTRYYTSVCCLSTARNTSYIAWYDSASGYNATGFAYDGFLTTNVSRRSERATFDMFIRQPNLALAKTSDRTLVGANSAITYVLQVANLGLADGYDIVITDALPSGLTYLGTLGKSMQFANAGSVYAPVYTDTNLSGASLLTFEVGLLPAGAAWTVTYTASVDSAIAAGITLTNQARIVSYGTQAGVRGDSNGDGAIDEREYSGALVKRSVRTPDAGVLKWLAKPAEVTVGSTLVYRILVPSNPINATMYNVLITDVLHSSLNVTGLSNATLLGGKAVASFASIPPNTQRSVYITATVALPSVNNLRVSNRASMSYQNLPAVNSNSVVHTVLAPAFVTAKWAHTPTVQAKDEVLYTVSVFNAGNGTAKSVRVSDRLPENMRYVEGSSTLDGEMIEDPSDMVWLLPDLGGRDTHLLQFRALVADAKEGEPYVNTASVTGIDVNGVAIPADNSARVSGDSDNDDTARARVYGPLVWDDYNAMVAYEDLKRTGWSDWDYNDLVVNIQVRRGVDAKGMIAAVLLDYQPVARGAAFDHILRHRLTLVGGGQAVLTLREPTGELLGTVTSELGGKPDVPIFDRTRKALLSAPDSLFSNTPITQKESVVGQQASLMVVLDRPEGNPIKANRKLPWDPYLYVINTRQEIHLQAPGSMGNTQAVNAVRHPGNPMIGFDLPLAQAFPGRWMWPAEGYPIWRGYPMFVDFMSAGGAKQIDWFESFNSDDSIVWRSKPAASKYSVVDQTPNSRYYGNMVVAAFDATNKQYLIAGNLQANRVEVLDSRRQPRAGWPKSTGGGVKAAPAVADLDGDGVREIFAGATNGYLYGWRADGAVLPGFPIRPSLNPSVTYRILATPAIGDIDGDGSPDIVTPLSDGRLYAYNADGSAKWNAGIGDVLDVFSSQALNSSPVIADIDGDGTREILVGAMDNTLYALRGDGSLLWTFTTDDIVQATPVVADLDPARPGLETVLASCDGYVYVLDRSGALVWQVSTGWSLRSTPLVADVNGDGSLDVAIGGEDKLMWVWRSDGSLLPGWPKDVGGAIVSSPRLGDIDGDGAKDLVIGADNAKVYAWHADGAPVAGWPKDTAASVKGAAGLMNIDSDARLEVIIGDFGGALYMFGLDLGSTVYLPLTRK